MRFKGEIHDFSVFDLLHYIHEKHETGLLSLRSAQGEESELYFDHGQCVRVNCQGLRNLGDILLAQGKLGRAQVDVALSEQARVPDKALGLILQEQGSITKDDLREALTAQIQEGIEILMRLHAGSFDFEHQESRAFDDIRVKLNDLVFPEEVNTAYMLLDAVTRFNAEGEKTEESGSFAGAPDETNLSFSLSLLRLMMTEAAKLDQNQNVLTLFLNLLSEYAQRAVLFSLQKGLFVGVGGFGKGAGGAKLHERVRKLALDPKEPTIRTLCDSREPWSGDLPNEAWVERLLSVIGAPKSRKAMVLPVGGAQGVTAIVYADMGEMEGPLRDSALLGVAAAQTGILMENVYLRNQIRSLHRRSLG